METRVAVLAIIIEQPDAVPPLNTVLHGASEHTIGRMGLPYPKRGIHIISIAVDAPQDVISSLAGKLGNIPNVSVKIAYSNVIGHD